MDIDSFVELYRADWERLARATDRGDAGLRALQGAEIDEVVRLYLRVSGHLAEARERYPDPQLVAYLTGVVGKAHGAIYGSRSKSAMDALRALGPTYRRAVRGIAPFVLTSAGLFLAISTFAVLWIATSAEARAGVLPPAVAESIRSFGGEPADFGVGAGAVSTLILLNNIQVAFLGFAMGITLGIGTIIVLGYNALHLGVIAGGFIAAGKGAPFWALVLPHGLLELTAIFIACGAGLRMGWSLVAPGDLSRGRALAAAAREAVLVVAGVIPAFVVAGFIEGYISGSSALPAWAELGIGVVVWLGYCAFLLWPGQSRPKDLARRYMSASVSGSSSGGLSTTHAPS